MDTVNKLISTVYTKQIKLPCEDRSRFDLGVLCKILHGQLHYWTEYNRYAAVWGIFMDHILVEVLPIHDIKCTL